MARVKPYVLRGLPGGVVHVSVPVKLSLGLRLRVFVAVGLIRIAARLVDWTVIEDDEEVTV
jgi:hypothetical protein